MLTMAWLEYQHLHIPPTQILKFYVFEWLNSGHKTKLNI